MQFLKKNWKWVAIVLALVALSSAASLLSLGDWIKALSAWAEKLGPFGVVIFALIYAAATVLFLPGSLLTIAAGLVFGVGLGLVAAWTGALLGSALAFLIARYVARGKVEAWAKDNEKFAAIDQAIGEQGWKIVALLRLSPLIPFNVSNYLYGVTRVGFWPYLLASAGGMLPGTLLYVYLGAAGKAGLGGGAKTHSPLEYWFFGLGLVATIVVTVIVTRIAKKALKPEMTTDKITKSDAEWKAQLTPQQYEVLREKGTERAGSGELLHVEGKGTFVCAGCANPLFDAETKFESGTGWPSFYQPLKGRTTTASDSSHGMTRDEVLCTRCDGHLGHVFNDGPPPTGLRYCMNSISMKFEKAK